MTIIYGGEGFKPRGHRVELLPRKTWDDIARKSRRQNNFTINIPLAAIPDPPFGMSFHQFTGTVVVSAAEVDGVPCVRIECRQEG